MIGTSESPTPLGAEETARLNEFARACKAAARAVALYPPAHPAIATTLARIVDLTSSENLQGVLRITVLPDSLLLDGRPPARIEAAVTELAVLLHDHLVGELSVLPGGDIVAWRELLVLLGRIPDAVRTDGGIAHLWAASGGWHVELQEIDYAEVLRERAGCLAAAWEQLIVQCLRGQTLAVDEQALRALTEVAADPQRLADLMAAVDQRAAAGGLPARIAALMALLRGLAEAIAQSDQDNLEATLRTMAAAMGRLSPELMMELLAQPKDESNGASGTRLVGEVLRRMSDETVAGFVARNVADQGMATDRLAQAFQALVPDPERQRHVLGMAQDEAAAASHDQPEAFESLWTQVSELLTSYSDSAFVSGAYAGELASARMRALDVERVSDDPPDRMAAWLGTVGASAVRVLDLTLLLDLLRIEEDPERWRELMNPIVTQIEDLLLLGDIDAAEQLVTVLAREAGSARVPMRKPAAMAALEQLSAGPMMEHIVSHLATLDEGQFERLKSLCLAIGGVLVRPLAEMLAAEDRGRTRERLTALLIAFGPTGRTTIERLKSSRNPAVRRTAIYLMREFGGSEALPDLKLLLEDTEPQVQREAVRAILTIGTEEAYEMLRQALATSTPQSRDEIMLAIALVRDERATPLFAHILRHVDHRGALRTVYLRAIESLGVLRDPEGVEPLKAALYRGEWWAPRRTALLRTAAAGALARIGTPAAVDVLAEAAASQSRGIRAVARPALDRATRGAKQ